MDNSKNISRNISGIKISQRAKDGYINATQLCIANEKLTGKKKEINEWIKSELTKSILEKLSNGFEDISLVEIQHNNLGQEIWLHRKLALRFAIWLNEDFSVEVQNWVEDWCLNRKKFVRNNGFVNYNYGEATLEEIDRILDPLLKLGFQQKLITELKLSAIAESIPRLENVAQLGKQFIQKQKQTQTSKQKQSQKQTQTSKQEQSQKQTQTSSQKQSQNSSKNGYSIESLRKMIAQKYKLGQVPALKRVNKALLDAQLQSKYNNSQWKLTKKGKQYAKETMRTSKKKNPVVEISWFPEVLDQIEKYFKNK